MQKHVSHFDSCLKQIFFFFLTLFLGIFFQPSLAPKLLKLSVYVFSSMSCSLENLGYEHAFQPYTYFLRPFSIRGAVGRFPLSKHRFRTCSLNRVKLYRFYLDSKIIKDCWLSSFNIVVCFSILELSEKPKSKIQ